MMPAHSFADLPSGLPCLLTIGTFDGVHRGHRLLLEQARERARARAISLVIVTFEPCPALVLRPGLRRYQLSAADIKVRLLTEFDPACILLLPFTIALSRLSAGEFMDALEARLAVRELWLGEDFHFGHDREGDARMLAERGKRSGFALHVVERRTDDPGSISSSRIRRALDDGDVELALQLLGYPFCLEPTKPERLKEVDGVEHTAYDVENTLAIPAAGDYAVLISTHGTPSVPAACTVDTAAPHPLYIIGRHKHARPLLIEFIARLDRPPMAPRSSGELYRDAVAFAAAWHRPHLPPAGSLS
jgi:riboflavin kinase / FMN adenylyltransferase